MPKLLKPLTKREINKLPDGRFAVGGTAGLYVEKSNGKIVCWILRDRLKGRHQYYPGFLALDAVRLKSFGRKKSVEEETKRRKEGAPRKREKTDSKANLFLVGSK